jgi:hypothetical protein
MCDVCDLRPKSEKRRFDPLWLTGERKGPRIPSKAMIIRGAIPFLVLAALLLPLPLFFYALLFAVLLAVRPRGEPGVAPAVAALFSGPPLLRSPPV